MSVETNRATVERYFEAVNRLDVRAGLDDVCSPDFTVHFPGVPRRCRGKAPSNSSGCFSPPFLIFSTRSKTS